MAEIGNTNQKLKQEELLSLLGSLASMAGGPGFSTMGMAPDLAKGLTQGNAHENIDAILENNTLDILQGIVSGVASSGLMGPAGPGLMGSLPEQLNPLNQLVDMISELGAGVRPEIDAGTLATVAGGPYTLPLAPLLMKPRKTGEKFVRRGAGIGAGGRKGYAFIPEEGGNATFKDSPPGQWSQAARVKVLSILDEYMNQLFEPSKPMPRGTEPQQRTRGRTGEPRPTQYR